MRISDKGKELIIKHEQISSKVRGRNVICTAQDVKNNIIIYPYFCPAGKKTIGIGCLIEGTTKYDEGVKISETFDLFHERLKEFESMVAKWLNKSVNRNQFNALMCFCFNIPKGAKAICSMINDAKSIEDIKDKWLAYSKVNGITQKGLLERRKEEFNLFTY